MFSSDCLLPGTCFFQGRLERTVHGAILGDLCNQQLTIESCQPQELSLCAAHPLCAAPYCVLPTYCVQPTHCASQPTVRSPLLCAAHLLCAAPYCVLPTYCVQPPHYVLPPTVCSPLLCAAHSLCTAPTVHSPLLCAAYQGAWVPPHLFLSAAAENYVLTRKLILKQSLPMTSLNMVINNTQEKLINN